MNYDEETFLTGKPFQLYTSSLLINPENIKLREDKCLSI